MQFNSEGRKNNFLSVANIRMHGKEKKSGAYAAGHHKLKQNLTMFAEQ